MSPIFAVSFILLVSISSLRAGVTDRPEYINCQTNSECPSAQCCSIGPIRYSTPQCKSMQQIGDVCRPSSDESVNMTVGYPDGVQIELTDVHYILCPCAQGLSCDRKEGVCKDAGGKKDSNQLAD